MVLRHCWAGQRWHAASIEHLVADVPGNPRPVDARSVYAVGLVEDVFDAQGHPLVRGNEPAQPYVEGSVSGGAACRYAGVAPVAGAEAVLAGDQPMTQATSVARLLEVFDRQRAACILGTAHKENPNGLGRIVRDADGNFLAIVEQKDATDRQRRITEVNLSYYVFDWPDLPPVLEKTRADNAQREHYLTDAPGLMLAEGKHVQALDVLLPCESLSVNTVEELAAVQRAMEASG